MHQIIWRRERKKIIESNIVTLNTGICTDRILFNDGRNLSLCNLKGSDLIKDFVLSILTYVNDIEQLQSKCFSRFDIERNLIMK